MTPSAINRVRNPFGVIAAGSGVLNFLLRALFYLLCLVLPRQFTIPSTRTSGLLSTLESKLPHYAPASTTKKSPH
ncbi:hypothetical protein VTL71DRAFT_7202 [Oculimacula yallundae]|uniref:Uncharacterized protein n=1 Tax=Oculimacula yallundae TaxID=86028 RepID=A0ABR4BW11_9HELO